MYLDELNTHQQARIIQTVNEDKPYSECPEQSEAAKQFFDSLLRQKATRPGVIFELPEIDTDDKASQALRSIMFDGMDLQ